VVRRRRRARTPRTYIGADRERCEACASVNLVVVTACAATQAPRRSNVALPRNSSPRDARALLPANQLAAKRRGHDCSRVNADAMQARARPGGRPFHLWTVSTVGRWPIGGRLTAPDDAGRAANALGSHDLRSWLRNQSAGSSVLQHSSKSPARINRIAEDQRRRERNVLLPQSSSNSPRSNARSVTRSISSDRLAGLAVLHQLHAIIRPRPRMLPITGCRVCISART